MTKTATVEDAIAIAAQAHKGQKDKAGAPYLSPPLRKMMPMTSEGAMMAAVLHDVVGGTGWALERLREEGFSHEVLEAVDCLTGREGESYQECVERVRTSPVARQVKMGDLEENMNIRPASRLGAN